MSLDCSASYRTFVSAACVDERLTTIASAARPPNLNAIMFSSLIDPSTLTLTDVMAHSERRPAGGPCR
jgi:hypothetical protein